MHTLARTSAHTATHSQARARARKHARAHTHTRARTHGARSAEEQALVDKIARKEQEVPISRTHTPHMRALTHTRARTQLARTNRLAHIRYATLQRAGLAAEFDRVRREPSAKAVGIAERLKELRRLNKQVGAEVAVLKTELDATRALSAAMSMAAAIGLPVDGAAPAASAAHGPGQPR
jgi:hypothetical protein